LLAVPWCLLTQAAVGSARPWRKTSCGTGHTRTRCAAYYRNVMNELLITGNISETEVELLQSKLSDVEVIKYQTKGYTPDEFVQLVFHNLDALTFTRDFLLANALNYVIAQIKFAVKFFKSRNKRVEHINLHVQLKDSNKEVLLYISAESDRIDSAISMTDEQIEIIVKNAKPNQTIHIKLDKGSTSLDISDL